MPKLNGRPPKYRHHKSSDRAVVELDGRSFYLGRYNSPESWEQYHRLVGEWLANGRRLPASFPAPQPSDRRANGAVLVNHLVLDYWRFAKNYYRRRDGTPTSERDTIKQALRVLRRTFGRSTAAEFGPKRLKVVRAAMVQTGWSRPHVNKQASRVKSLFRWAVENELIPSGVHHGLLAVRQLKEGRCDALEPEPVRPVEEARVAAVLPHVSDTIAAMIRLQLLTGMRPAEVVPMRASDLDTSGVTWTYRRPLHKTAHHGKARVIFLGAQAQMSPDQLKAVEFLKSIGCRRPEHAAAARTHMTVDRWRRLWSEVLKRCPRPAKPIGLLLTMADAGDDFGIQPTTPKASGEADDAAKASIRRHDRGTERVKVDGELAACRRLREQLAPAAFESLKLDALSSLGDFARRRIRATEPENSPTWLAALLAMQKDRDDTPGLPNGDGSSQRGSPQPPIPQSPHGQRDPRRSTGDQDHRPGNALTDDCSQAPPSP